MADNIQYKEIQRVPMSSKSAAVLSEVWKDGKKIGYYLNDYVQTPKYTGPTKGVFIPNAQIAAFKTMINGSML